jgi:hypothetical protein
MPVSPQVMKTSPHFAQDERPGCQVFTGIDNSQEFADLGGRMTPLLIFYPSIIHIQCLNISYFSIPHPRHL